MLSPAERLILSTCKSRRDMFRVIRAARSELLKPGSGRFHRLGFANTLRYVLLVGLTRQPILYVVGPIIALISYVIFFVGFFRW